MKKSFNLIKSFLFKSTLPVLFLSSSVMAEAQETYVYFSAYSSQKIAICKLDTINKKLIEAGSLPLDASPFALTTNSKKDVMYASLVDKKQVASFSINNENGELSPLNHVNVVDVACHLRVSPNNKFLLSAYFGASKVAVYPLESNGKPVSNATQVLAVTKWPHMLQLDPTGQFAFAPNMGADLINQYSFNQETGELSKLTPENITTPYYTGPRHMIFHPTLPVVYFSMERSSQTIACHFTANGLSSPFQTMENLPDDYQSEKWSSDIHITPNGKFLYTANRVKPGDSDKGTITAFRVNETTGELTLIDRFETEKTVREFDIDPSGKFLIAAGEKSGKAVLYEIMDNGHLNKADEIDLGSELWWVMAINLTASNTTGMYDASMKDSMKLYPNPSNGVFCIELPKSIEKLDVKVINSNGTAISSMQVGEKTSIINIDIKDTPSGIYQVIVTGKNQQYSKAVLLL